MARIDATIVSYDTVDEDSRWDSPKLDLQLKATKSCDVDSQDNYTYSIPMKNYNDLRRDTMTPAILVVLFLPQNCADWIKHSEQELVAKKCAYWISLRGKPVVTNTSTITIHIPKSNVFSPVTLKDMMNRISKGVDL